MKLRFNSRNRRITGGSNPTPPTVIETGAFAKRSTSLLYREEGSTSWQSAEGMAMNVPDTNRIVHTVELTGLQEDSIYEFRLFDKETPTVYTTFNGNPSSSIVIHWHTFQPHLDSYEGVYSDVIQKCRTLPSTLTTSIKFAQLSDTHGTHEGVYNTQIFEDIASRDVRCMIHSGDLATGDGGESPNTWYTFFNALKSAVDSDGCIIPILPNLGNHEILLGSSGIQYDSNNVVGIKPNFETHERGDAEWYFCFFPKFPGLQGYGVIDFGDYASVWQLDPGISTHTNQGQQTWLADTLSERSTIPHKLISLHYSPFPIGRRTMSRAFNEPRRDFAPVYEPYRPLVMTGHEHVWGLTVPILGGSMDINEAYEDPNGVVYIGSAPAGTSHREGRNPHTKWWIKDSRALIWDKFDYEEIGYTPDMWNEEREPHEADGTTFTFEEVNNWWLIELENDKRTMTAYDLNKNEIYSFLQTV